VGNQQEQQGEARQWHEEAGWLAADPHYLRWLESLGPWWLALDQDKEYIEEHQ
jgi:hypothetical protein